MKTLEQTAKYLQKNDHFLILTHRRPDGDAVGSAAALCMGLRQLGKDAELFPNPQFGAKFSPLYFGLLGSGDPRGKKLISVDLAAETLLPYNAAGLAGRTEFAIDHHGSHQNYAKQWYVDAKAAACGEIILRLLQMLGAEITPQIADALYIAIATDTGRFCYDNTTADTFRAAAVCREAGADTAEWNRILFTAKTMGRRRIEAYLTEHTELYRDGKLALCMLPNSVVKDFGVQEDELDDISGFPRDLEGVQIGVMIRDVKDGARISLRTDGSWDASAICAELGGGGHAAAAGATVPGTLEDGKAAILNALKKFEV